MGILLLLQVTYILTFIIITFTIIPSCGNLKGKTFRPCSKSKQSTFENSSKKNQVKKSKNTLDSDGSKIRNVSKRGKILEKKLSSEIQNSCIKNKTSYSNDKLSNTKSIKNKKSQNLILSIKDYDEEIEEKLKGYRRIIENSKKNTSNNKNNEEEIKKKSKSIKKILNNNNSGNEKIVINKSQENTESKIVKDAKSIEKKSNIASNFLVKSKSIVNFNKNASIENNNNKQVKLSYAGKEKKNDCINSVSIIKKDCNVLGEDDRYINLVELSIAEGIINPDIVELKLQKTQRSNSLTLDDDKIEQENLKDDRSNEDKYESLAAIQDLRI
uniref:Uncharacterized protein n=1 Tax=Strongyloides stercoralis TaxID=6248 RepID=A0A0K0EIG5_STRER